MHPIAEKYLRKSALPLFFCQGCGDGTILAALMRAVDEMGIREKMAFASGIGCAAWIPVFMDADTAHTMHGRAIPVATGLKLTDPDRNVMVFAGDGDCMGIGGNHLIHAARRNIDITVVMVNNAIYGMTGGQTAPTTPHHAKTKTTPMGNAEHPFDACQVAIAAGATYVARWTTAHPAQITRAFKEAINHKGFSFVEVISQCPTQAGRLIHGTGDPIENFRIVKNSAVTKAKAEKMTPEEMAGKVIVGKLHEV
ncbi:MAG TPA: thiamine pyrophosphate-dependent enzyme, partial [Chloroflexota bacterium]|nr:thiamine pyrophosphate-dependent enzyme [Chloroflexota bacterium]